MCVYEYKLQSGTMGLKPVVERPRAQFDVGIKIELRKSCKYPLIYLYYVRNREFGRLVLTAAHHGGCIFPFAASNSNFLFADCNDMKSE